MAQNSNAFVQTFEKGLQILEYLVEEKTVSVTGVAKRMGIQKSASYRFLNTLRLHGYVDKDQHNSYRLTDRLSKLGKGMVPKREFYNIVAQFLDNLAKKNKENNGICNLGMWNGKEIVYMVQSANDKYMLLTVGSTVPAYCSALGKAVLAYLPDEALENYIQRTEFVTFTESTVNSAERLRADLQAVRERAMPSWTTSSTPASKAWPCRSSTAARRSATRSASPRPSTVPRASWWSKCSSPCRKQCRTSWPAWRSMPTNSALHVFQRRIAPGPVRCGIRAGAPHARDR